MAAASPSSSSSSVRQRLASRASPATAPLQAQQEDAIPIPRKQQQQVEEEDEDARRSRSALYRALTSTANLSNLLPTGTLLAFNLLSPTFTNHGACDDATRFLTRGLLAALALSCALASFTDSVRRPDTGRVYYGVATPNGLWLLDDYDDDYPRPPPVDTLSRYRLRFLDFVHAALSVAVFGVVAARDRNVVACFYGAAPGRETAEVLDILPLGVGVLCSLLFLAFPTRRHGIGYPVTTAH